MIKVSIIIPVCNVEKYLRECMESVINQTLQEIEIICVDDGSTDKCPKILDEYAVLDSRVVVIHQENAGYGRAMNVGLEHALGEYIGIVESDDYVELNMFEVLYEKAKQYDLEVLKSHYYQLHTDEEGNNRLTQFGNRNNYENIVINFREDDIGRYQLPMAMIWSSIYKRDFLKKAQIYFNESPGASYQDVSFRYATTYMCTRYMYIPDAYYCYRIDNPNSSVKSREKIYCVFEEFEYLRNYLKAFPDIYIKNIADIFHNSLTNYFWSMSIRINTEFTLELCQCLQAYIIKHKQLGEFRQEYLEPNEDMIINLILDNPYKASLYFKQQYANRQNILRHIIELKDSKEKIYIYGAGIIGQSVMNTFVQCKATYKITGFVVTNLQGKKEMGGIPYYDIEAVEDKKCILIVAVSKYKSIQFYYEMRENAIRLGFENIVDYDEL